MLMPHILSDIEDQINGLWGAFYEGSEAQKMGQEMFRNRMAEFIKDKRLLEGFTPTFGLGCRRITPGDPYMIAIQEENVDVHFVRSSGDRLLVLYRNADTVLDPGSERYGRWRCW